MEVVSAPARQHSGRGSALMALKGGLWMLKQTVMQTDGSEALWCQDSGTLVKEAE